MQRQNNRKLPELLAPAGSMEALLAALRCGADAVYVGGKQYSARQNAENFDLPALEEAARLCHLYSAKLYLAVNTLLLPHECNGFASYIRDAASVGIDACIVQDLGAAKIVRTIVPDLPLHASTQMTIHSPEGVLWAKEQGFRRIVAARELSRQEVAALCQYGVEVEQFVHGALCMSVSGQCYLSALIGGRSANRGCCAQACRLPFSATGNPTASSLSLKDLCLIPYTKQLIADGISSLKIEGRMKRPEYVAAAVCALRAALDGQQPNLSDLRAVFSRSGFTDGYYNGKLRNMFGTRKKEDVAAARAVLPRLAQTYQRPPNLVPLNCTITVQLGKPVIMTATDPKGHAVTVTGHLPEKALHRPTDPQFLQRIMGKMGDTIYTLHHLAAYCDGQSTLSVSECNALRRACTTAMDAVRIKANTPTYSIAAHPVLPKNDQSSQTGMTPAFWIQLHSIPNDCSALLKQNHIAFLLLPCENLTESLIPSDYRKKIMLVPPRFTPEKTEQKLEQQLTQLMQAGYAHLLCQNVAHIRLGSRLGYRCHGGVGLNLANPVSLSVLPLEDATLSPELTLRQTRQCVGNIPVGIYGYGQFPAMLMRNCPIREEAGCRRCTHYLIDRTKRRFYVRCHADYTELCNAMPVWLADKSAQLHHLHHLILDFAKYKSLSDIQSVLHAYQTGSKDLPDNITRGLYFRGIQ